MSERDGWCTPRWLTALLPMVDVDPCGNARSHVRCKEKWLHSGLERSWDDLAVFVNPPYSAVLPWAMKAAEARAFIFLVNLDPTTKWWRALQAAKGHHVFLFARRIQFEPPRRVAASTNPKAGALVCNGFGRRRVGARLDEHGTWMMVEP